MGNGQLLLQSDVAIATGDQSVEILSLSLANRNRLVEPAERLVAIGEPAERIGQFLLIVLVVRVYYAHRLHRRDDCAELGDGFSEPALIHEDYAEVLARVLDLHPIPEVVGLDGN